MTDLNRQCDRIARQRQVRIAGLSTTTGTPDRWVRCVANDCGDDVRLVDGRAPSRCPGCGHVYTPPEQDVLEAADDA